MVKSIMRSVGDSRDPVSHRYGRKVPDNRRDERQIPLAQRFSDYNPQKVEYRYSRPQQSRLSSQEAISKLSATVDDALDLFQGLQSSFVRETSLITYVDSEILDYIWQDKLRNANANVSKGQGSKAYGDGTTSQRGPPDIGIIDTVKELRHWLDQAISAAANEMHRSAGDNRSLAEKLNRSFADINNSLKGVWKTIKETDILITELEMLRVLLKRYGGERGSDKQGDGGGKCTSRHNSSYEYARVDDGDDAIRGDGGYIDGGNNDQEDDRRDELRDNQSSPDEGGENGSDWGAQATGQKTSGRWD
ncbi:MAG: hypothetical protein Q9217_003525 [Psora testacea]